MLLFLKQSGLVGLVLLALSVLIIALVIRATTLLRSRNVDFARTIERNVHAILFWGVIAALLGFMGQCLGIYRSLTVIREAEVISPRMVAEGLQQSFFTSFWGFGLLVFSGVSWLVLRQWLKRGARGAVSG